MPHLPADARLAIVVDGGGSKTDCNLLASTQNGYQVLSRGRAGAGNPATVGVDCAVDSIVAAIRGAYASAPEFGDRPVERAALALAGTLDEKLCHGVESRLTELKLASSLRVFPDVTPIVLAASPTGVGVAIIAGTGSVAVSRTADGRMAVTGGWGYLLGDEGSGYAIGRSAVRHALEQLEIGANLSPLAEQVCHSLDSRTVDAIKRAISQHENPRQRLAALAEPVLQLAAAGDRAAQAIVAESAVQLAKLLQRGLARIEVPRNPLSVALAGGVLSAASPMHAALIAKIKDQFTEAEIRHVDDPLQACQLLLRDDFYSSPLKIVTS